MIEFAITFSNGRIQTLMADGYVVDGPWIDFQDRAGLVALVRAQDLDSIRRWTAKVNWDRLLTIHHAVRPKPKG